MKVLLTYCSNYLSCTECNAKVDAVDVCGKCTKCYALMLTKCKRNVVCKVKIKEDDDKSKEATFFANILTKLNLISSSVADSDIESALGSANPEVCDQ